jgi:hypothetical protein
MEVKDRVDFEILEGGTIKITKNNRSITAHASYFFGAAELEESLSNHFEEEEFLDEVGYSNMRGTWLNSH